MTDLLLRVLVTAALVSLLTGSAWCTGLAARSDVREGRCAEPPWMSGALALGPVFKVSSAVVVVLGTGLLLGAVWS